MDNFLKFGLVFLVCLRVIKGTRLLNKLRLKGNDMNRLLVTCGLTLILAGCTKGYWVKEGATQAETEQDSAECQTVDSMQPAPATLGDKIGMPTEMSTATFEKCMRGKGYKWVQEETNGGQKDR